MGLYLSLHFAYSPTLTLPQNATGDIAEASKAYGSEFARNLTAAINSKPIYAALGIIGVLAAVSVAGAAVDAVQALQAPVVGWAPRGSTAREVRF